MRLDTTDGSIAAAFFKKASILMMLLKTLCQKILH